jgi:hypothetical protein
MTARVTVATNSSLPGQSKKKGNSISWVAPLVCIISGYLIWRFIIGADSNFTHPDPLGGWHPHQEGPKSALARMYQGGVIVPILIGTFLTALTFVIERFLTVTKATGANIYLDKIPKPAAVTWERWLVSFPSFGYLITAKPGKADEIKALFRSAQIACEEIGEIIIQHELVINYKAETIPVQLK